MKAKKHQPLFEIPDLQPTPRFRKAIVLDYNDTDQEITKTILKACYVATEIEMVSEPNRVIHDLHNIERLSQVPELIFVNLSMKALHKFDFLEEFAAMSDFVKNKCKLIILTDKIDLHEKHRVLQNPSVVRYLTKPLDAFQLREFVNQ